MQVSARESPKPLRCPYCHDDIDGAERTWVCPECETKHHAECARLNGGCTLVGCEGVVVRRTRDEGNDGPSRRVLAFAAVALLAAFALFASIRAGLQPPHHHDHEVQVTPREEAPAAPAEPVVRDRAPRLGLAEVRMLGSERGGAPGLAAGAFSGDRVVLVRGKTVVAFDDAGRIAHVGTLPGEAVAAAFTPDGGTLVFLSADGDAWRLFHVAIDRGRVVGAATLVSSMPIGTAARLWVSPDGRRALVAGSGEGVAVWELDSGRRVNVLDPWRATGSGLLGEPLLLDAGFASDRVHVLTVHQDGVRIWDPALERTPPRWESGLQSGVFVPGSARVLSLLFGNEGQCLLWDSGGDSRAGIGPVPFDAERLIVTPDGRRALAFGSRRPDVGLIDVEQRRATRFPAMPTNVGPLARSFATFDRTGSSVLLGGEAALVFDAATGRGKRAFVDAPDAVTGLVFLPSSRALLVARADGTIRNWTSEGARHETLHPLGRHGARVEAMAGVGRSATVVSASADGTVHVWRSGTGEITESIGAIDPPRAVAVEPSVHERILIGDANGRLWLHEPGTASPGRMIGKSGRAIAAVVPLANDRAATLDDGGTVTIFGWAGQAYRDVAVGVRAITTSQGELVVAFATGEIAVVDRTGDKRVVAGPESPAVAIAAHPDGRHVATASLDGTVTLWDLATHEPRAPIATGRLVTSLAFSEEALHVGTATGEVLTIGVAPR